MNGFQLLRIVSLIDLPGHDAVVRRLRLYTFGAGLIDALGVGLIWSALIYALLSAPNEVVYWVFGLAFSASAARSVLRFWPIQLSHRGSFINLGILVGFLLGAAYGFVEDESSLWRGASIVAHGGIMAFFGIFIGRTLGWLLSVLPILLSPVTAPASMLLRPIKRLLQRRTTAALATRHPDWVTDDGAPLIEMGLDGIELIRVGNSRVLVAEPNERSNGEDQPATRRFTFTEVAESTQGQCAHPAPYASLHRDPNGHPCAGESVQ